MKDSPAREPAMLQSAADLVDRITASRRRALAALAVIALASFLPGFFSLPAVDRDEARYAQAVRQMVQTGDWVDIRLQDVPRYKKPVGIYWLQSVPVALAGKEGRAPIWMHRLPSLVAAVAAVLLTYWVALPLVGRGAAFLAGSMMAVSLVLGVEARLAKTDAALLASVLVAEGVLVRAWLRWRAVATPEVAGWRPWLYPLLFWTALAAGILVKGPLIVLYIGLTVAALSLVERSLAWLADLRPLAGLAWCLALALPWFVAIGVRSDGAFFRAAMVDSVAGKILESHEGHGAPPLTHLLMFWGTFWPGSLIVALAIPELWRRRGEYWMRYLASWAGPAWLVFELITTKLPHYLLPALPAIAIAAAGVAGGEHWMPKRRAAKIAAGSVIAVACLGGGAAIVAALWFAHRETPGVAAIAVSLAAVGLLGLTATLCMRAIAVRAGPRLFAGLLLGIMVTYWLLYPALARIEALWPARQVGEMVARFDGCAKPFLVSAGYHEPSLVFSTRTDLVLSDGAGAAEALSGRDCGIAIVAQNQLPAFLGRARAESVALTPLGSVSGLDIGGADWLELSLFSAGR